MFDKKNPKITLIEKRDVSKEGQDKIVEKRVSEDQIDFKSNASD